MVEAYKYIQQAGGIESEEDYPFEGVDGECRFDQSKVVMTVKGYEMVKEGDENVLKQAVAKAGPISVESPPTRNSFCILMESLREEHVIKKS